MQLSTAKIILFFLEIAESALKSTTSPSGFEGVSSINNFVLV